MTLRSCGQLSNSQDGRCPTGGQGTWRTRERPMEKEMTQKLKLAYLRETQVRSWDDESCGRSRIRLTPFRGCVEV